MAQLVLLSLLGASLFCWAVILTKARLLRRAQKEDARFLEAFWKSKNIEDLFQKIDDYPVSPVASVFKSGYRELKRLTPDGFENVTRSLSRASTQEVAALEKHLGWLATIASAAPFVGLFGTVWGIMNSFQSIGATGAANLAVVAPGISEALVTTATGIGAAIPAVIAYNHFGGVIRRRAIDMDGFSQDFLNLVHRSIAGQKKG